jgi:hypothetical protein
MKTFPAHIIYILYTNILLSQLLLHQYVQVGFHTLGTTCKNESGHVCFQ